MSTVRRAMVGLAVLSVMLAAAGGSLASVSNPNGIVFRAVGIFQGTSEAGRCTVPNAQSAIADQAQAVCRDGTEFDSGDGTPVIEPTVMFPAFGPFFLNFCGGFLALQNNMINQAVNLRKVKIRYTIPGQGFPPLCRGVRRFRLFVGGRVDPVNSSNPNPFGAPNMIFMQMLPIFSPQLFDCLRDPARGDLQTPTTLRAVIRAVGRLDDGRKIRANRLSYTLTLLPNGASPGAPPDGFLRCTDAVP